MTKPCNGVTVESYFVIKDKHVNLAVRYNSFALKKCISMISVCLVIFYVIN